MNGDGVFETVVPKGEDPSLYVFTLEDTMGCTCEQIAQKLWLGYGHIKFGFSLPVMEEWILYVHQ